MIIDGSGHSFEEALKKAIEKAKESKKDKHGEYYFSWSLDQVFGFCENNSNRHCDSVHVYLELR